MYPVSQHFIICRIEHTVLYWLGTFGVTCSNLLKFHKKNLSHNGKSAVRVHQYNGVSCDQTSGRKGLADLWHSSDIVDYNPTAHSFDRIANAIDSHTLALDSPEREGKSMKFKRNDRNSKGEMVVMNKICQTLALICMCIFCIFSDLTVVILEK